jgi:flagellar FlgN protein
VTTVGESLIGREVLTHLDDQIASARRLLGTILAQGEAIRARQVEGVVERLAEIKTEMGMRERLEQDRTDLLTRAGLQLGLPAAGVTLEAICELMSPVEAEAARGRSAELRGLLDEIVREHGINRALMRQELAFLDHLVRLIGDEPEDGYRPDSAPRSRSPHRVLDLQA